MVATVWAPGWILKGCARCNQAIKRPANEANRRSYCTVTCERNDRNERARFARSSWRLSDAQSGVPLHHIYPDMPAVMATIQERRPSYPVWASIRNNAAVTALGGSQ